MKTKTLAPRPAVGPEFDFSFCAAGGAFGLLINPYPSIGPVGQGSLQGASYKRCAVTLEEIQAGAMQKQTLCNYRKLAD